MTVILYGLFIYTNCEKEKTLMRVRNDLQGIAIFLLVKMVHESHFLH